MKSKPIYAITAVRKERDKSFNRTHCFGYYHTKEKAIRRVLENAMDFHENEYTHAVIEETQEGIYPPTTKEIWFKWQKSKWIKCEQPRWAKYTCNWGIG